MKNIRFSDILTIKPKSKVKAGEGLDKGHYPFFTSSANLSKYIDNYLFDKPSLIFGTGGQASVHYCDSKFNVSTDCFVAQADNTDECDIKFVYFFFKGHLYLLEREFKGAGLKHISKKAIENIIIPLPPLPEQKRIATILDKADALRQKNKQLMTAYDELLQSLFLDLFGDPVTNPKGWDKIKFGNVIIDIVGGHSVGGEQRSLKDDEFGVLKVSAVTTGTFLDNEYKAISKNKIDKPIINPRKGDLLFSRANTREMVGAVAIVDKNYDRLFLPDKLWRIDLDLNKASQYYCHKLLSNNRFRPEMSKVATGTSGSMLNISKAKLRNLRIPLPPIELQNQFAQIVENIEAQKVLVKQSIQESDNLFNGLVQKAFKGELTGKKEKI
jgi:type I restriction enzyme S subunit